MNNADVRPIYLDHNASTPVAPEVAQTMSGFLTNHYGNPSSGHWASDFAKKSLETARVQVADFLGAKSGEIIFTSGGTESNNLALKGAWFRRGRKGNHIITSSVEHDAIRSPLSFLKKLGAKVSVVPVDRYGIVDPDAVCRALTPETTLVSIMQANNETGTIQPIADIASIVRAHGALMHTDAAQSAGKIPINIDTLGVDLLSFSGHKLYGPKGIGALYVRDGIKLEPHNHGAGHEGGRRAGTESALLAAGLGAACESADKTSYDNVKALRDFFWWELQDRFGERVVRNGHADQCVPNTLNVSFVNEVGAEILAALDGVAAATGSACHAGCIDMSKVLIAMRVPVHVGMGAIRFSLGHQNTMSEIQSVLSQLENTLN